MIRIFLVLLTICSSIYFIGNKHLLKLSARDEEPTPVIKGTNYDVMQIIRRPQTDYTQGVFFNENGDTLYESGGLYGQSILVKLSYPLLAVEKKQNLDKQYFAEGIAKCQDSVYQLTWQERTVLRYSYPDIKFEGKLEMDSAVLEGWGLSDTSSPDELVASDGSSNIHFLDCKNGLKVLRSVRVTYNGNPLDRINALAYAEGFIWANRYYDHRIFKIEPSTGKVVKLYDMTSLVDYEIDNLTLSNTRLRSGDVLNGIAYNKSNGRFLLTGKRWGYYYDVVFK